MIPLNVFEHALIDKYDKPVSDMKEDALPRCLFLKIYYEEHGGCPCETETAFSSPKHLGLPPVLVVVNFVQLWSSFISILVRWLPVLHIGVNVA